MAADFSFLIMKGAVRMSVETLEPEAMDPKLLTEVERQERVLAELPEDYEFPPFDGRQAIEFQRRSAYTNTARAAREIIHKAIQTEEKNQRGLLLTVDPPQRVPTGAQFLTESRDWLQKQKARIVRIVPSQAVQAAPAALEHFALETEMAGQKVVMDYYVARQAAGGVTLAARLLPKDAATLQREVEGIARSLRLTRPARC
jgi:hypothetical protein